MELLLEKFKINNKCQLNSEDITSLTQLYLPLIGIDSYALYSALTVLECNKEYFFKKLVNMINISSLKSLNNSFNKLEGIGLLKTYYNKDKGYIFNVVAPLSVKEFLKEEALVTLLETQIGIVEVEELRNSYKDVSRSYKDITKKLNEVFTITTKTTANVIDNLFNESISVENPDFNYSLFRMLFDSNFIDDKVFDDEQFKTMIIKISYVYKLNEDDMKDIIFKSINNDQRCDYASLSKYARITFQKKYKVDTPKLVTIEEDEYIQSIQDDATLRLCNELESKKPAEVLESISGMKPTPSELKIFEDLLLNTKLTRGAINFMILYVNKEKNGELPGYNYFEKIATTWMRAKVKTAYDAILYVEKKKEERNKPNSKTTGKKEAPLPDWYTEYEKELNTTEEKPVEVTEELAEIAKKLFED